MDMLWKAIVGGVAAVLAGCSTLDSSNNLVFGTVTAPVDPSQVKIYFAPYTQPTEGQYERVAQVEGTRESKKGGISSQKRLDAALGMMKQRAACVGANALVVGDKQRSVTGTSSRGGYFGTASGSATNIGDNALGNVLAAGIASGTTKNITATTMTAIAIREQGGAMPPSDPKQAKKLKSMCKSLDD